MAIGDCGMCGMVFATSTIVGTYGVPPRRHFLAVCEFPDFRLLYFTACVCVPPVALAGRLVDTSSLVPERVLHEPADS